jgi:phthiocerol/phenolphthiocerol synthesis type-I polyketide synthase E
MNTTEIEEVDGIAIVGMAGRFPGARNIDEFWRNLRDGVEAISFFTEEELRSAGVDSALLSDPSYVRANATMEDTELFDASFFGINHREAEIMDPQHRIFLECAWEALENAGYDADSYQGRIGVYAGHGVPTYLLSNLYSNRQSIWALSGTQTFIGNDKDHLSTRVSYKLNLHGPSLSVQTACSTSLVAVHVACQSLLNGECSMALAGGITIWVPHKVGYKYDAGGILSPDGHCRAFDAAAKGTVNGNGVGIVVLKRLEDALAEGDTIHAVIKGSAINNDGSQKAGYTAPSIEGQAAVISEAMHMAGVDASTITYVEAHGTGTVLGDPIEVAALTQAFRTGTQAKEFCAIGSVKTNIGHLDTAAGVAGLIKTVLALKNKELPPSLHYQQPNPAIDFANSPFYVNSTLTEWTTSNRTARRAGVSSFGIGGTNSHVIVEEAPQVEPAGTVRPLHLIVLSAKTGKALQSTARNLAQHLKQHPDLNIADVAHTLQLGRKAFDHRLAFVCSDLDDAATALEDETRVVTSVQETNDHPVLFMFPGQGSQHVNMGAELYQTEQVFREQIDRCSVSLQPHLGLDLRTLLYPQPENVEEAAERLKQTIYTQPALFVVEYALAQLWMSWGVRPRAMIGHSIGEYVAACIAGVLTLDDALKLVAARGRLMQSVPGGAMTSVSLAEAELAPLLDNRVALAAVNGPSFCVISGTTEIIEEQEELLSKRGYLCRRLHTSHAFHSGMMDSIIEPFVELVKTVKLSTPKLPYISNLTGTWITADEATDPHYWSRHLRGTVRFDAGVRELLKIQNSILLEVGPGRTLTTLAKSHLQESGASSLHSLPGPQGKTSELRTMLDAAGALWLAGRQLAWAGFSSGRRQQRIPLPTYPFERKRYWIDPQPEDVNVKPHQLSLEKRADISDWFYTPLWKQSPSLPFGSENGHNQASRWLVFIDGAGLGPQIVKRLEQAKHDVFTVQVGEHFEQPSDKTFTINPERSEDYKLLLKELAGTGKTPERIVHLWSVTHEGEFRPAFETDERSLQLGFYSLLFLVQALGAQNSTQEVHIDVLSSNMQSIAGEKELCPEKAAVLGPCRVIPQEYPNITCRSIDVVLPESGKAPATRLVSQLVAELARPVADTVVAYRNDARWVQFLEPISLEEQSGPPAQLRDGGVYLITGGLGGIARELAEYLAKTVKAKLILLGRSETPPRVQWESWLTTHDPGDPVSLRIRRLQAIEEHGGEPVLLRGDVTDRKRMQEVVAEIHQRFGVINGVVHAAGIGSGGLIQLRTSEQAAAVLAAKVQGLRALEFALNGVELDFFLLCSSLTSVLGSIGQVDYCAASQFMDSFARYDTLQTGRQTISVNWDAWQGVGLAIQKADWFKRKAEPAITYRKVDHPLLGECIDESADRKEYSTQYSVAKFWTLDEHRIAGRAVLPGTAYLEIARAAYEELTKTSVVELTDFYFVNILYFEGNEIIEAHTLLERNGSGFKFVVRSKTNPEDDTWQEHAVGKLMQAAPGTIQTHNLKELLERCTTEVDLEQNGVAGEHGPRWRNLKSCYLGTGELLARIELPEEFSADLENYKLHPAIMDIVTGAAKQYLADGSSYLPLSYKKVSIHAPLQQRMYAHARAGADNQERKEVLTFDAVIMDEQGRELVNIEGFSARKISDSAATIKAVTEHNENGNHESSVALLAEASREEPVDHGANLLSGITPDEGVKAFGRILSSNLVPAQVVVSSTDIHALIEQSRELMHANVATQVESLKPLAPKSMHPRPEMDTPYVEPRNEQEQKLAEIWQTFLGIDKIGIHDNFFELGGDSVVAIHFIARANEAGLQLSPQQLFNSPTIAGLAVIADQRPDTGESSGASDYATAPFEMVTLNEHQLAVLASSLDDSDEMDTDASDDPPDIDREAEVAEAPVRRPHEKTLATVEPIHVVPAGGPASPLKEKQMMFSLFYFSTVDQLLDANKYQLYLEGAKFADRHGFSAIWTPERHFQESGGLYPNPSVLSAALATITKQIQLRAGSVVLPLHHYPRVVEEWSVVDNLSNGRTAVSFTSGWVPNDFAFFPERFTNKRDEMFHGIEEVRRLWRGETFQTEDGAGNFVELKVLPRPVQPDLPIWLTCNTDPQMFVKAGELGFNVLTALLSQSVSEVAGKIALYREARAKHGHDPEGGQVTLMMHTFVGKSLDEVLAKVRAPLTNYLKSHVGLVESMTKSLNIDVGLNTEQHLDAVVAFAFERYYRTASLIGTPEKCLTMIKELQSIGVDEVACFIDFGLDVDTVLEGLGYLSVLKDLCVPRTSPNTVAAGAF